MDKEALPMPNFQEGEIILIDKPLYWSSFDVVNKIKQRLKYQFKMPKIKIGHAGTLDPMATGLLIICTGKFTKKLTEFQEYPKAYTGIIRLGESTPSFDTETEVDVVFPTEHINDALLASTAQQFIGEQQQYPPIFSAIKVDGKPLYKTARRGETMEIASRPVTIYDFALGKNDMPNIHFAVRCSKGTYIRSLAHDFGKALQSGGFLLSLTRTEVGGFHIKNAWKLNDYLEQLDKWAAQNLITKA